MVSYCKLLGGSELLGEIGCLRKLAALWESKPQIREDGKLLEGSKLLKRGKSPGMVLRRSKLFRVKPLGVGANILKKSKLLQKGGKLLERLNRFKRVE